MKVRMTRNSQAAQGVPMGGSLAPSIERERRNWYKKFVILAPGAVRPGGILD
jgi:hypothetical protein